MSEENSESMDHAEAAVVASDAEQSDPYDETMERIKELRKTGRPNRIMGDIN